MLTEMPERVASAKKKPTPVEGLARAAVEPTSSQGAVLSRGEQELVSRTTLKSLQARAGNQAVVGLLSRSTVQREPPPAAAPSAITIADLDKELGGFSTSKDKVVDIIGKLSTTDKQAVLAGYKGKLAHALDFAHMKQATISLGATLPVKLDWMQAAAFITSGIAYSEIRDLITAAPQGDRDMLKNDPIRRFSTRLGSEAIRVGQALGYELEEILHLDPEIIARAGEGDEAAMQTADAQRFKDAARTASGQRPSMGQDMQKGRRTEIEFLNGLIVRDGEKIGLPCRANAVLVDLVKRVEKGELKPDPRHITELRLN